MDPLDLEAKAAWVEVWAPTVDLEVPARRLLEAADLEVWVDPLDLEARAAWEVAWARKVAQEDPVRHPSEIVEAAWAEARLDLALVATQDLEVWAEVLLDLEDHPMAVDLEIPEEVHHLVGRRKAVALEAARLSEGLPRVEDLEIPEAARRSVEHPREIGRAHV